MAARPRGHASGAAMTWGSQSLARKAAMVILVVCGASATPQHLLKSASDHVTTFEKRQRDSDSLSEIVIEHIDGDAEAAAYLIGLVVLGVILIGALLLLGCLLLLRKSGFQSSEYHRVSTEDPESHHEKDASPGQSQQFTYVDLAKPTVAGGECCGQGLHTPRFSVQLVTTTETDASKTGLRREQLVSPTPAPRSSRLAEVNVSSPVRRPHSAVSYDDSSEAVTTSKEHGAEPQRKRIRVERVSPVSGFRGGSLEDGDVPMTYQECCEQLRSVPPLQVNIQDRFINADPNARRIFQRPSASHDATVEAESAGPAVKTERNECFAYGNTSTLCEAPLEGYRIYETSPGGVSNTAYGLSESIVSPSLSPTEPNFTGPQDSASQPDNPENVVVYGHGRYYKEQTDQGYNGRRQSSPFESTGKDGLTMAESMTAQAVPVSAVVEVPDNKVEVRDGGSVSANSLRDVNEQFKEEAARARRTAVSPRKATGSTRSSVTPTRNDVDVEARASTCAREAIDNGPLRRADKSSVQVPEMIAYFDRMHKGLESNSNFECSSKSGASLTSGTGRLELPLPPIERTKKEIIRKLSGEEAALSSGIMSERSRQGIQSPTKPSGVQEIRQQPTQLMERPSETPVSSNRIEERTVAALQPSAPPLQPTLILSDGEHTGDIPSVLVEKRPQFPSSHTPQAARSPATAHESKELVKISKDTAGPIIPKEDKRIQRSGMHDEVSVDVAANQIAPRGADGENRDGEFRAVSIMPDQQMSTKLAVKERTITDAAGTELLPGEIADKQASHSAARSSADSGPTLVERTATTDALTKRKKTDGVLAAKYEHQVPGEHDAGPEKRIEDSSVFPKQLKPDFHPLRSVEDSSLSEQPESNLKRIVSHDLGPPVAIGSFRSIAESTHPRDKTVDGTSRATFLSEGFQGDDVDKSRRGLSAHEQLHIEAVEAGAAIHDIVEADKHLPPLLAHKKTSVVPVPTPSASSGMTERERMFSKEAEVSFRPKTSMQERAQTNLEAKNSKNVSVVPTIDKRVSFIDVLQPLSSENRAPANKDSAPLATLPRENPIVPYGNLERPLTETTIQGLTSGERLTEKRISSFEALAPSVSKTPGSLKVDQRELSTLPADHTALVPPSANRFPTDLPDQTKPSAVPTATDFLLPVTRGRDTSHVVSLNESVNASGPLVPLPSSSSRAMAPRTHHKLPIEVIANKKRLEPADRTNNKLIVTRPAPHPIVEAADYNKSVEVTVPPKITAISSRLQPKRLLVERKNQEVPPAIKSVGNVESLFDHTAAPLVSQPVGAVRENLPAPPANPTTLTIVPQPPNNVERSGSEGSSVQLAAGLIESAVKERSSLDITEKNDSVTGGGAPVPLESPNERMIVPRTSHEPPIEATERNKYVEEAVSTKGTGLDFGGQPKWALAKGANEEKLMAARLEGQVTSPYDHSVAPSLSQPPIDITAGQQGLALSTSYSTALAARQPSYMRTKGSEGNVDELKPSAVYATADSAHPVARGRDTSKVAPTNDTATSLGRLLPSGFPNRQIASPPPHKLPVEVTRDKNSLQPSASPRDRLIDLKTPYGPPVEAIHSNNVEPARATEPVSHGEMVLRNELEHLVEIVENSKSILPGESPSQTPMVPRIEPKHPIDITDDDKSIQPTASTSRTLLAPRTEHLHPTEAIKDDKFIEPAATPSSNVVAPRTGNMRLTEVLEDVKFIEPAASVSMPPHPLEEHHSEVMEPSKSVEPSSSAVMPSSFDSSQNNGPSDGMERLNSVAAEAEAPSPVLALPLMGGELVPVGATSDSSKGGGTFAPRDTFEEQMPSAPNHDNAPTQSQPQAVRVIRRDSAPSDYFKESSTDLPMDSFKREADLYSISSMKTPTIESPDISPPPVMTAAEFVGATGYIESSTITPGGVSEEQLSRSRNYDGAPLVPDPPVKFASRKPKSPSKRARMGALVLSDFDPYIHEGAVGSVGKLETPTVKTTGALSAPSSMSEDYVDYVAAASFPEPAVKLDRGRKESSPTPTSIATVMLSALDSAHDEGAAGSLPRLGTSDKQVDRGNDHSTVTPGGVPEEWVEPLLDGAVATTAAQHLANLAFGQREVESTKTTAMLSAVDYSQNENALDPTDRLTTVQASDTVQPTRTLPTFVTSGREIVAVGPTVDGSKVGGMFSDLEKSERSLPGAQLARNKQVDRGNDHSTVTPGGAPEEWVESLPDGAVATTAAQQPANIGFAQREVESTKTTAMLSAVDYSQNTNSLDPTHRLTTVQDSDTVQPTRTLPTFVTSGREIVAVGPTVDGSKAGGIFSDLEKSERSLPGTPPQESTAGENPSGSSSEARQPAMSPDVFFGKNSPVLARGSKDLIVFNQNNIEPTTNAEDKQGGPDNPITRAPTLSEDGT